MRVRSCARCGDDHPDIHFRLLTNPVEVSGLTLTHWAPCPKTGEPILMRMVPLGAKT